jgi:hypothetical protein
MYLELQLGMGFIDALPLPTEQQKDTRVMLHLIDELLKRNADTIKHFNGEPEFYIEENFTIKSTFFTNIYKVNTPSQN